MTVIVIPLLAEFRPLIFNDYAHSAIFWKLNVKLLISNRLTVVGHSSLTHNFAKPPKNIFSQKFWHSTQVWLELSHL